MTAPRGPAPRPLDGAPAVDAFVARRDQLAAAAEGLRYVTEADAPFAPAGWPGMAWPATDAALRAALDAGDAPLARTTVAQFFRGQIEDVDPADAAAQALVPRFRALRDLITTTLREPVAVRVGAGTLGLYVLGGALGGVLGLGTTGSET